MTGEQVPGRLLEQSAASRCLLAVFIVTAVAAVLLSESRGPAGLVLAIVGSLAIAFVNGANDLPKSVATLIGTYSISPRTALTLGALATVLGGTLAVFWSGKLLTLFSTGGITVVDASVYPLFPLVVIAGAGSWILLATKYSLPVSTTHALVGASVGGAVAVMGTAGVQWYPLALAVVVPLLAGPLAAGVLGYLIGKLSPTPLSLLNDPAKRAAHVLSATASSAARALNDTPKIVGVGLLAVDLGEVPVGTFPVGWLVALAALAMALGGLWASRPVIHTLAFRVTQLDGHSGLTANATNSALVGSASFLGLPLSTTHVSGAALVGAARGFQAGPVRWPVVKSIVGAWLVTVPGAAALAALFWWTAQGIVRLV